jgi:hypothetical protein
MRSDPLFTKGPAISEVAMAMKLGTNAPREFAGKEAKCPKLPLIKMNDATLRKTSALP